MDNETFINKVTRYFSYLETEYKFKVILAKNSNIRPQTDGVVRFASTTTIIIVDSETGQAAVRFVRLQDDERYYLDPVSIHEYLNTSKYEKEILLSRRISDKEEASTIFNKKFLLSLPNWNSSRDDVKTDLEIQLQNYANWLRENASFCLLGDFSRWPEFYEYKINRLVADELRSGGKEFVKAVVRDENGTLKTIERPILHREREHLAKIKEEIMGK